MANYKKAFNFKHGVQVDVDNFVVNSIGNVGIGTSAPRQLLDVYGTARVNGLTTTTTLTVTGDSQFNSDVKIGTAVTISNGIVTATTYYGNGYYLDGVIGFTTDGFVVHTASGGGARSGVAAYDKSSSNALFKVGIGTTVANNSYDLVVGGDPNSTSGISLVKEGNLKSSGTITATGGFIGTVRSSDLRATIDDAILPDIITSNINQTTGVSTFSTIKVGTAVTINSGVVTATTFVGSLTGTATNSSGLTGTPNISVGIITGNNDIHLTGAGSSIGIGTDSPTSDIQVRKSGNATLNIVSDNNKSRIAIGQSVGIGNSTAIILFDSKKLEIRNKDTGNIDSYIHDNTVGVNTGNFNWIYGKGSATRMTLTYDGNLGINRSSPTHKLDVNGISTFSGAAYFSSTLDVEGETTLLAGIAVSSTSSFSDNVSIGGTLSFTGRITVPVVNDAAQAAYATTATGTIVFNSTDNKFRGYRGNTLGWVDFH